MGSYIRLLGKYKMKLSCDEIILYLMKLQKIPGERIINQFTGDFTVY